MRWCAADRPLAVVGGASAPLFVGDDGLPVLRPVHVLIGNVKGMPVGAPLRRVLLGIPEQATQTLVLRVATASDPLVLWALHAELTRRQVAPCLRWPANCDTLQAEYVTWTADLAWIARLHPGHTPAYRGWAGIFRHPLGSDAWHATAHRQFVFISGRYGLAHYCSKGLGLTDQQRADLMTLPTKSMAADRRQLDAATMACTRAALLDDAYAHPDRSAARTPEAVADRRARLWQTYILAGRNATATARCWALLTGEALSRQAVRKQLDAIERALGSCPRHRRRRR